MINEAANLGPDPIRFKGWQGRAGALPTDDDCSREHSVLSLREFAEKILENLRKKLRQKTTKNAARKAELASNSRNYWQIIADLGQITKCVAYLESLFAYCGNNLRTGSWKTLYTA